MNDPCLDIGTIQAFLDGELPHDSISRVSGHIAKCGECAAMLAVAEDESAIVFPALAREFDSLVPTHRLWSKINDSIQTDVENLPLWRRAYTVLTATLASPSYAVAAGLIIVAGISFAFWPGRSDSPSVQMNTASRLQNPIPSLPVESARTADTSSAAESPRSTAVKANGGPKYTVERASYRPETAARPSRVAFGNAGYLPGEESFVKTISTLSKSVDEQKDSGVMRASERIAYEREMAVVEDSIGKMKKEVRRNPKNESAKQVLYASYQNKIDLLNSVSQKEELLVSLK
ncbi:MAG: zf-HC2 domain-containing protein [Pyrinomonadaceae bacterium]